MSVYSCFLGQSLTDVTLNTYGTLDSYVQLLYENGIVPDDVPYTAQKIVWGTGNAVIIPQATISNTAFSISPVVYTTSTSAPSTTGSCCIHDLEFDGADTATYTKSALVGKSLHQVFTDGRLRKKTDYSFTSSIGTVVFISPVYSDQTIDIFYK